MLLPLTCSEGLGHLHMQAKNLESDLGCHHQDQSPSGSSQGSWSEQRSYHMKSGTNVLPLRQGLLMRSFLSAGDLSWESRQETILEPSWT